MPKENLKIKNISTPIIEKPKKIVKKIIVNDYRKGLILNVFNNVFPQHVLNLKVIIIMKENLEKCKKKMINYIKIV